MGGRGDERLSTGDWKKKISDFFWQPKELQARWNLSPLSDFLC